MSFVERSLVEPCDECGAWSCRCDRVPLVVESIRAARMAVRRAKGEAA